MNENVTNVLDFNRRDFLRSGSVATLMTMLGGVELFGQTNAGAADAQLVVSSGYRSPQSNKAIGSVHPESLHTRGRALDLEPMPVTVIVGGTPTARRPLGQAEG